MNIEKLINKLQLKLKLCLDNKDAIYDDSELNDDGKFLYEEDDGRITVVYKKDDKYHREDGPAYEDTHQKRWFFNGFLHRLDGSAVEYPNGKKEYWIYSKQYNSKKEHKIAAYLYKNQLENYK